MLYLNIVIVIILVLTGFVHSKNEISRRIQEITLNKSQLYETKDAKYNSTFSDGSDRSDIIRANNLILEKWKVEENTWHILPYKRMTVREENGTLIDESCEPAGNTTDDFPDDIFTEKQREQGAILLHFFAAIYCFSLLAVVCNDYFIPSVECICEDLNISQDVAAATFMAVATSCPELAVNIISTFITQSDMGVGTIVGSALFNTLGVGAVGGLAAIRTIPIDWWPLTRDCIVYTIVILTLVAFTWDGRVYWYEAMVLLILYVLYFILMFNSHRIKRFLDKVFSRCHPCCRGDKSFDVSSDVENTSYTNDVGDAKVGNGVVKVLGDKNNKVEIIDKHVVMDGLVANGKNATSTTELVDTIDVDNESIAKESKSRKSLWRIPNVPWYRKVWWLFSWPIKLVLTSTIPSPKTWRKLYPVTFVLCIFWIGANSYMVFWMVALMGATFNIPDSVMGLTLLAAGGCLPESISIVIMSRKGEGGMGVSNSLGANSLAILMSLGMPWFVRTLVDGVSDDSYLAIGSEGIGYSIMGLVLAVVSLYIVLTIGGFRLKKSVGACLMTIYVIFATLAILFNTGVIGGSDCPS